MKENLLGRAAKRSQPPAGCFRRARRMKRGHGCPAGTGGVRGDGDGGCWALRKRLSKCAGRRDRKVAVPPSTREGPTSLPRDGLHSALCCPEKAGYPFSPLLSPRFISPFPFSAPTGLLPPITHRPLTSPGQPRALETFQTQRLFQTQPGGPQGSNQPH